MKAEELKSLVMEHAVNNPAECVLCFIGDGKTCQPVVSGTPEQIARTLYSFAKQHKDFAAMLIDAVWHFVREDETGEGEHAGAFIRAAEDLEVGAYLSKLFYSKGGAA